MLVVPDVPPSHSQVIWVDFTAENTWAVPPKNKKDQDRVIWFLKGSIKLFEINLKAVTLLQLFEINCIFE